MLNKNMCGFLRGAAGALALFAVMALSAGCASKQEDTEIPLWASYDTIEAVYPTSDYIARIAYSEDRTAAAALAESELGSYFSHSVHSVVQGRQVMTDSASGAGVGAQAASVSRKIERTVTVESLNKLFDVKKTTPWYNRQKKQYVCCAYIKRADAWKLYEGSVRDACNKFHTFYDRAAAEKDPIRKLSLLDLCQEPAEDFFVSLEMARLLLPGKENAFAEDRKLAEGLELEKEAARINSVIYVNVIGDESGKLARMLSQMVSDTGLIITKKRSEAVYEVLVELDFGKSEFGETMTAEPGLSVSMKSIVQGGGKEKFSYRRNLPKQSGFTAAQALIERKILTSAEEELKASFPAEFSAVLK